MVRGGNSPDRSQRAIALTLVAAFLIAFVSEGASANPCALAFSTDAAPVRAYWRDLKQTYGLRLVLAPAPIERERTKALGFAREQFGGAKESEQSSAQAEDLRPSQNSDPSSVRSSARRVFARFGVMVQSLTDFFYNRPKAWLGSSLAREPGFLFTPLRALTDPLIYRPIRWATESHAIGPRQPSQIVRSAFLAFVLLSGIEAVQGNLEVIRTEQERQLGRIQLEVDLAENRSAYESMVLHRDPRLVRLDELSAHEEKIKYAQAVLLSWRSYIGLVAEVGGADSAYALDLAQQRAVFGELRDFHFAKASESARLGEIVPELGLPKDVAHRKVTPDQSLALYREQHLFMQRVLASELLFNFGMVGDAKRIIADETRWSRLQPLFDTNPGLERTFKGALAELSQLRAGSVQLAEVHRALWSIFERELYHRQNAILNLPQSSQN